MADNFGSRQQGAGNRHYQDHPHPSHQLGQLGRHGTRSNDARNLHNIDNQSSQQDQHARMHNYQNQTILPPPQYMQQRPDLQPERSSYGNNGSDTAERASFSFSALFKSPPEFRPHGLLNQSAALFGGATQRVNHHWAEQLNLYKKSESQRGVKAMQFAAHYHARSTAPERRCAVDTDMNKEKSQSRPSNIDHGVTRQYWRGMDMSGQGLQILTAPLFNYTFLNELYIAGNKIRQLPAEIGKLRQLKHLDASGNLLTSLPRELGMCVFLRKLLVFDNMIRTLPGELGSLYLLEILGIEGNPLQVGMKHEVMESGTKSLIWRLKEEAHVPLPPAPRSMLDIQDGSLALTLDRFKVSSYNILCQSYVNVPKYPYVAYAALNWEYRKVRILQDIIARDADFICLQEVSAESFTEFFSVRLAQDYVGVFYPKTRAIKMPKEARMIDGCAIFYKGSKYILLDKEVVEFAKIGISRPDMQDQDDMFNRFMPRDNIALVTLFENSATGARLVVANTHIYWNPGYADVKLIQTAILLDHLSKLSEKYAKFPARKNEQQQSDANDKANTKDRSRLVPEPSPSIEYKSGAHLPMVLCGDLNSTPDSSVYELLSKGHVSPDHRDLAGYHYGLFTQLGVQHPFSLRSAYSLLDGTLNELPFTNYTPEFQGNIDYIWYSTNTLEPTALLGPPDPDYMKVVPGFPHYHFPSDHLSLLAEFSVKPVRKENKEFD